MAGEFDNITNEIKEDYPQGFFQDYVNLEAPYPTELKAAPFKGRGGFMVFPARLAGSWSVSVIADGAAFPSPLDPTRDQFRSTPELFAGTIEVGIKAKAAVGSEEFAWHEGGVLQDRIDQKAKEIAKYMNILYAGANRTRLGNVSADGSNTITMTQTSTQPRGAMLIKKGMPIDVYTAHTSGSVRDSLSNRRVTAVNYDTNVVTYNGADQTAVSGDHVYVAGSYGQSVLTLDDIVDDGTNLTTIQNLSRTTYPELNAQVLSNGGVLRNLDEQLILTACSRSRHRVGERITKVLANDGQSRKYAEFVQPERRISFQGGPVPAYGVGYKSTDLNKTQLWVDAPGVHTPFQIDVDCSPNKVYCLAWQTFGLYSAQKLNWLEPNGQLLHLTPNSTGYDASVMAFIGAVENQVTMNPGANAVITDLKDQLSGTA